MKKIFIILVCLSLFPTLSIAKTPEEERRIEEEKRESLRPSEARIFGEREAGPEPMAPIDLVYFAELMQRRIAFRYDACKVLVILMGVENQYIDLDSQTAFLREKNLLPKKFKSEFDPMEPLRKGLTAYMFCKALGVKGGLSLMLFGMRERYALKELVFQGMMSSGNVRDIISGEELVSILTQAANRMGERQEEKPEIGGKSLPGLAGKSWEIASVNREHNFVLINMRGEPVKEGMVLDVFSGEKLVGKVKIYKIARPFAYASIVSEIGGAIEEGNLVKISEESLR